MILYSTSTIKLQLFIDDKLNKEIEIELMKPIIGIDIGTSTSCIALMHYNKVDLIPDNATGERIIQSIECLTEDNYLFGRFAINNMIKYAKSTIFQNQRIFGLTDFKNIKNSKNPFIKIVNEPNNIKYITNINNKEKIYSPEEVLEDNLKYIKNNVDIYTKNKEMKKTIITYPEYLNKTQQDKIINIAKKVGFKNVKLLKVSEASAIGYKSIIRSNDEKKVIIFNLGGGTFEVSIVKINRNKHEILSSICLNDLGGEDFHEILMKYVIEEIKKKKEFKDMNFNDINDLKILRAYLKIIQETEKLKQKLSSERESKFEILELNGNDNCVLKIERIKYKQLCLNLWNKCLDKVEEALKKANLKKEDINEITLIGGCTRTPKIQQMIEQRFNIKPLQNVNAEEIVAQGAAYSYL
jgi:heat shock protein 5